MISKEGLYKKFVSLSLEFDKNTRFFKKKIQSRENYLETLKEINAEICLFQSKMLKTSPDDDLYQLELAMNVLSLKLMRTVDHLESPGTTSKELELYEDTLLACYLKSEDIKEQDDRKKGEIDRFCELFPDEESQEKVGEILSGLSEDFDISFSGF